MNPPLPPPSGLPKPPTPGIARPVGSGMPGAPGTATMPKPAPNLARIAGIPTQKLPDVDLDAIALVDEPAPGAAATGPSKIRAFSSGPAHAQKSYTRKPNANGAGACRVRSFHGRLSDEGIAYLDDKVNEWLDQHGEIEVKFVTTSIGMYDGKIKEPALVMNVWY